MKIKDLPKVDMPREKLERYGVSKLLNHELLAILLGSGIKGLNVLDLAKKILRDIEKTGLKNITFKDLLSIKGLGKAKASEIIACLELGKRLLQEKSIHPLLSPKDVWERMGDVRNSKKEHFIVFYLDSRNQEIQKEIVSIGILNESLVHPREVFENAIKNNAAAIIIAHNHPSGSIEPSEADISVTKRLVSAGKILDIEVLDHIIVSKDAYISMKELDLL